MTRRTLFATVAAIFAGRKVAAKAVAQQYAGTTELLPDGTVLNRFQNPHRCDWDAYRAERLTGDALAALQAQIDATQLRLKGPNA